MGSKLEFIQAVLAEVETITDLDSTDDMDAYLQELRERVQQAQRYIIEIADVSEVQRRM